MRLPHPLIDSVFFQFESCDDLLSALGEGYRSQEELAEISRLAEMRLPPVTSDKTLASMLGVNPGIIWSMRHHKSVYYRRFRLKKAGGRGFREIVAPRVALKIFQKWIGHHLQRRLVVRDHVYGFVPERSHIQAARLHLGCKWVLSLDIEDFFTSTTIVEVKRGLIDLGYGEQSATIIADLCTLKGVLPQGSPASPVLSNLSFGLLDDKLSMLAEEKSLTFSRYADDMVFSGSDNCDPEMHNKIIEMFEGTPWNIAPDKTSFAKSPQRLKVHGLLVHGKKLRLTKGYRNRIRAFRHLARAGKISAQDLPSVRGHLEYASCIERAA